MTKTNPIEVANFLMCDSEVIFCKKFLVVERIDIMPTNSRMHPMVQKATIRSSFKYHWWLQNKLAMWLNWIDDSAISNMFLSSTTWTMDTANMYNVMTSAKSLDMNTPNVSQAIFSYEMMEQVSRLYDAKLMCSHLSWACLRSVFNTLHVE